MSNHKSVELYYQDRCKALLSDMPDFIKDYMRSIRTRTAPRTQYEYLLDIRRFLTWYQPTRPVTLQDLTGLTKKDFEIYLEYLEHYQDQDGREQTNGRRSMARKLSALSRLFDYLFQNELLLSNEIRKVSAPKIPRKEIIRLDKDETIDLLQTVASGGAMTKKQADYHALQRVRDMAIIQLLLATGLRVSECTEMDLTDLDLDHHRVRIIRKGGDEALIYLSDTAQNALEDWLDTRAGIKGIDKETAVFLSSRKQRMSVRSIEYMVCKYASRSVPSKHITPHKLRATFATALYNETGDIYLVADALGHRDITTTRNHYASMTDDRKKAHRNTVSYSKE